MRLPDNYFREITPAQIIAKVATITLANISLWGSDELERIGWLNNPVIDILYSMTSAGVWVARVDASGQQKVVEASALTISGGIDNLEFANLFLKHPVVGNPGLSVINSEAECQGYARRYDIVPLTSNAGGTLDADVPIPNVAAKAGYYGVVKILGLFSSDIGGAATPTLQLQDGSGGLNIPQLTFSVTGNYNIDQTFKDLPIWGGNDNSGIFIDTTSSNLGNTKQWYVLVETFYDT